MGSPAGIVVNKTVGQQVVTGVPDLRPLGDDSVLGDPLTLFILLELVAVRVDVMTVDRDVPGAVVFLGMGQLAQVPLAFVGGMVAGVD